MAVPRWPTRHNLSEKSQEMTSKSPPERESKIQRSIIVRLNRLGVRLWRRNVGALKKGDRFIRFSSPGQSDLWGIDFRIEGACRGKKWARHWEIEVKRPGNKPTPLQLVWLKDMSEKGCVAFWSDSANVAEQVAEAILNGGRIVWHEDENYDVVTPQ